MADLPILLTLFSIIGFIIFIRHRTSIPEGMIPIIVLSSSVVIGFFMIFLNLFFLYKILFCIVGNSFLLHATFKKIKNIRTRFNIKKNLLIIFFCISCIGLFLWVRGTLTYGGDEFAWGQFIKFIHTFGKYWTESSPILTQLSQYPPGGAILQDIFMPIGNYNETAVYFANIFPIFCLVYLLIDLLTKSREKKQVRVIKIIIGIIGSISIYFYFGFSNSAPSYATLDHTLGVTFASCLIILFSLSNYDKKGFFLLLPLISFMLILKTVGLILAVVTVIIFLFGYLIKKRKKIKRFYAKLTGVTIILILIIISFSPYIVWNLYVKKENLENIPVSLDLATINNAFFTKNSERYIDTWNNFNNYIYTKPLNLGISPDISEKIKTIFKGTLINWVVIFSVAFVFIITLKKLNKEKVIRDLVSYLLLFWGFIIWIIFHLYTWLVIFTIYEGVILASYERYIAIYLLGMGMVLFYGLLRNIKSIKVLILIVLIILFSINCYKPLFNQLLKRPEENYNPQRTPISLLAKRIKNKIQINDKLYFINQNSIGFEAMVFRYEMSPTNFVPAWGWSIGDKYYDKDLWTVPMNLTLFKTTISKYDYVVLNNIDDGFIKQFGEIFRPVNRMQTDKLWKITSDNDLYLIPIVLDN